MRWLCRPFGDYRRTSSTLGEQTGGGTDVNTPTNQWFDVPTFVIGSNTNVKYAELRIAGATGRKGVLYFDKIYID